MDALLLAPYFYWLSVLNIYNGKPDNTTRSAAHSTSAGDIAYTATAAIATVASRGNAEAGPDATLAA